jgi:four helix bundle protein
MSLVSMGNHQNPDAWKSSMQLLKEIYLLMKGYPDEEYYSLISQTKRAAVSVPGFIAVGTDRQCRKIRFNSFIWQEGIYTK